VTKIITNCSKKQHHAEQHKATSILH